MKKKTNMGGYQTRNINNFDMIKTQKLESLFDFCSAYTKLLHEWHVYIVHICIYVYMYVGSHSWTYMCIWGHKYTYYIHMHICIQ